MPGPAWEPIGPSGGYAASVLALGGGVVLAGTGFTRGFEQLQLSGGAIYRSTDSAKTFTRVRQFSDTTVASFVQIPGTTRVYAGVGSLSGSPDDGVWVSNDNGQTFTQDSAGLITPARVRRLSVAAGATERVYAMVEGTAANPLNAVASLCRRDAGGMWTLQTMTGVNASPGGPALAMVADVTDPNTVYLADGARFYVSNDAGATFTAITLFDGGLAEVDGLFADPSNAQHLLMTTLNTGLLESTDKGSSFNQTPVSTAATFALVANGRIFVGTDGAGLQVGTAGVYAGVSECPNLPNVRAVSVAPDNANSVFIGTVGGGVLASSDGANTFLAQQSGITEILGQVAVTGSSTSPTVWILAPAGIFQSTNLGSQWNRIGPSGGALPWSAIVQDPANPTRYLLATDEDMYEGGGSGVGVVSLSTANGATQVATGFSGDSVVTVAFDPSLKTRVYAYQKQTIDEYGTTVPTGLFVSLDSGATFSGTAMLSTNLNLTSWFLTSPLALWTDGTIYFGTNVQPLGLGQLWKSSNQGQTYSTVWAATETGPDGGTIAPWLPMGVNLDSTGAVYLVGRQNYIAIMKSIDQGATFIPLGTGLTGLDLLGNGLAISSTGGIVIATWAGAFYASDGMTFTDFNTGFAQVPVVWSVTIAPGTTPTVFAVTDQGIFRRTLQ
jgi:hypothetical protein